MWLFTSVLPHDQATLIERNIICAFPSEAKVFDSSLASSLLSTLSLYFWSLDYPSQSLVECHRAVDLAKTVLKTLSSTDMFPEEFPTAEELVDDTEPQEDQFFVKKRQNQRHRKKNSRIIRTSVSIDPKPFQQLNISVPLTRGEARQRAEEVLQDQQRILHVCCRSFIQDNHPELAMCSTILRFCACPNSRPYSEMLSCHSSQVKTVNETPIVVRTRQSYR